MNATNQRDWDDLEAGVGSDEGVGNEGGDGLKFLRCSQMMEHHQAPPWGGGGHGSRQQREREDEKAFVETSFFCARGEFESFLTGNELTRGVGL